MDVTTFQKNNMFQKFLGSFLLAVIFLGGIVFGQISGIHVFAQQGSMNNSLGASQAENALILNGQMLLNGSFDQSSSSGYLKTGTGIVSLNGNTSIGSGKTFVTSTGTTAAVGETATLNQQAGVVMTDELTGKTSYKLTIANSIVTTNSFIIYNVTNGTNTATKCSVSNTFAAGSNGSFEISLNNLLGGVPSACTPNGTLKVNFVVFNPQ